MAFKKASKSRFAHSASDRTQLDGWWSIEEGAQIVGRLLDAIHYVDRDGKERSFFVVVLTEPCEFISEEIGRAHV